jgi:hypothetical protein
MFDINSIISTAKAQGFDNVEYRQGKTPRFAQVIIHGLTNSKDDLARMEAAVPAFEALGIENIGVGTHHAMNDADFEGGQMIFCLPN